MKLTKRHLKALIEQELQNISYEMAPGTGGEGTSGIVEPQMSMEPEDEEEDLYSPDERAYAAAKKPMKIYSMGAGHPYMRTVQESNISKLKRFIKKSIHDTLFEGDITREKRYQWDDDEPESADEPEPPPEPDAPPVELISKAQELHANLAQTARMPGAMVGQLRRDLRELGDILNELAEYIGPGTGDTEPEARGHNDDDPGFELPAGPSTRSLEHQRLRKWRNQ
tara:strand:- start:1423 stop:2097 length:675 start_codon:yes stop_codon:yes gene_type:complete